MPCDKHLNRGVQILDVEGGKHDNCRVALRYLFCDSRWAGYAWSKYIAIACVFREQPDRGVQRLQLTPPDFFSDKIRRQVELEFLRFVDLGLLSPS